jgi:ethanolamine utilization protein EutP
MMKVLVAGPVNSGKTSLCHALHEKRTIAVDYPPTQGLRIIGHCIDTPGIYVSQPIFYQNLSILAQQARLVLLMLNVDSSNENPYPQGFAQLFICPVIGAITKVDKGRAEVSNKTKYLLSAGVKGEILAVSAKTGENIEVLRQAIGNL